MIFDNLKINNIALPIWLLSMFMVLSACAATQEKRILTGLDKISEELVYQLINSASYSDSIKSDPIGLTLFVDAENPEYPTSFGYQLRRIMTKKMIDRGFTVNYKLAEIPAIQILDGGDLRSNKEVKSILYENKVNYILTSSIHEADDRASISVSVVEVDTSNVLLSSEYMTSKDEYICLVNGRSNQLKDEGKCHGMR